MRVLVLGYGNTLRGDDGVGWRAAEELGRLDLPPGTVVRTLHQLAPELAGDLRDAETVLFLDAARGGIPGEVVVRPVGPEAGDTGFTHQLTPGALLRLTREVYGRAPAGFELSLAGACFDLGEELTAVVAQSLPRLVAAARARIGEAGGATPP